MEICVPQRTENWHRWRRKVIVTASRFADAVGLGSGKAFEYFLACTVSKGEYSPLRTWSNEFTRHGIETEPIIDEMYRLLTGRTTRSAGFCLPAEDDVLHGLSGCSPDGKVSRGLATRPRGPRSMARAGFGRQWRRRWLGRIQSTRIS